MVAPIFYCITVDTQEEWDWRSGYPTGPTRTANIAQLPAFQARCEQAGAAVVYFTNHAVLNDPASRSIIQQLSTKPKTEIGLHIHPWNTPPLANTDTVPVLDSYLHNLPWVEQQAKLDNTLQAFRDSGLSPTSFRGGRYSTSPAIQNYLRGLGLWVDCSVLPGTTWPDDGAPDYRQRDMTPHRRESEGKPIWELPLTFGNTATDQRRGEKWLKAADSRLGRALRLTGLFDRLNLVSRCWLNFENPLGYRMLGYLNVLRTMRPPFVSFTLHSSSLLAGGSPYNRTQRDVQKMLTRMREVLQVVHGWPEFRPATMTEIAQTLENQPR
jgi:hypothetical protein